ncbi:unnamed protein product [Sphagnum balticum]
MACCGCLACVEQSTMGMVEKWDRFSYVAQPGLHCLNPFLGEWMAGRLSLRVQSLDVRCDTKTKDTVFVTVVCSIQYRLVRQNADDAFYELQNPRDQIQCYVFDDFEGSSSRFTGIIICQLPWCTRMILDEVFEQKDEIAKAVSEELEKVMGAYGYSIERTLIVDIDPDQTVHRAMNEINAAVEKAEAEKILQVKEAEGEAEAKYLSGYGITRQHQAITEGLRESMLAFSNNVPGTSAKDVMDLVLVTHYFDTTKEIGNSS